MPANAEHALHGRLVSNADKKAQQAPVHATEAYKHLNDRFTWVEGTSEIATTMAAFLLSTILSARRMAGQSEIRLINLNHAAMELMHESKFFRDAPYLAKKHLSTHVLSLTDLP